MHAGTAGTVFSAWLPPNMTSLSASSVFSLAPTFDEFRSPLLLVLAFVALVLVRLFKLLEAAEIPEVSHSSSAFAQEIISRCTVLSDRYRPTRLWGRNTHIQAWTFGIFGRTSRLSPAHTLHTVVTEDGATVSLCLFENEDESAYEGVPAGKQPVVVICPGIAGNSYATYIQSYIDHVLKTIPHSRVVALNHLGTVKDEELTSPRIFSYGCTLEYSAVVDWTRQRFPSHPLLAIGFSMGANIVVKYLGERPERQAWFVGAMSCCQAYRADRCLSYFYSGVIPRLYGTMLLLTMLQVVRTHRRKLFGGVRSDSTTRECTKTSGPCSGSMSGSIPPPDEMRTLQARGLGTFDEHFSRRIWRFRNVEDYYAAESCGPFMHKISEVPILFLNSVDDPLVPPDALELPFQHSRKNDKSLFVKTRHGSHLAFFEGGVLIPNPGSWMDRLSTQYFNALLEMQSSPST